MSKMYIMKGLPASGKSTKAKEICERDGNTVRINKDLLRTMLHFDKFNHIKESHTRDAARKLADWYLANGVNVIIDDTNLNEGTVQSWKDLAKIHNAHIEYVDLTDVPVSECLYRDQFREKKVGNHVIQKMAMQQLGWLKGKNVVICDLDGTICDITHRLHYGKGETKNWDLFFAGIKDDTPRREVLDMVSRTCVENDAHLIFVSARPETYRKESQYWIVHNTFPLDYVYLTEHNGWLLIMRDAHDKRPDTEVKSDIYEKYLKHLNIVKVFDDRPSVIRMWREKGLEVEDVGQGIEF